MRGASGGASPILCARIRAGLEMCLKKNAEVDAYANDMGVSYEKRLRAHNAQSSLCLFWLNAAQAVMDRLEKKSDDKESYHGKA